VGKEDVAGGLEIIFKIDKTKRGSTSLREVPPRFVLFPGFDISIYDALLCTIDGLLRGDDDLAVLHCEPGSLTTGDLTS